MWQSAQIRARVREFVGVPETEGGFFGCGFELPIVALVGIEPFFRRSVAAFATHAVAEGKLMGLGQLRGVGSHRMAIEAQPRLVSLRPSSILP